MTLETIAGIFFMGLGIFILPAGLIFWVPWSVHKAMSRSEPVRKRSNLSEVRELINTKDTWERDLRFKDAIMPPLPEPSHSNHEYWMELFKEHTSWRIHAGMIILNGTAYMLGIKDYFNFRHRLKRWAPSEEKF